MTQPEGPKEYCTVNTSLKTLLATFSAALKAALLMVASSLVALLAGTPKLSPALVKTSGRRGAGFLEWALLGALALTIAGILWAIFPSAFSGLLNDIRDRLGQ
jgi:hypothetical protein